MVSHKGIEGLQQVLQVTLNLASQPSFSCKQESDSLNQFLYQHTFAGDQEQGSAGPEQQALSLLIRRGPNTEPSLLKAGQEVASPAVGKCKAPITGTPLSLWAVWLHSPTHTRVTQQVERGVYI